MNSVDELKLRLIDVWNSMQQNVIDVDINGWRKQLTACMHAVGQHFGDLLRARVTEQKLWTNKIQIPKKETPLLITCDFLGLKVSQDKVRTINR